MRREDNNRIRVKNEKEDKINRNRRIKARQEVGK